MLEEKGEISRCRGLEPPLSGSAECSTLPLPLPPLPQKHSNVIGRLSESDAERSARLLGALQDFGEDELVLK